MLRLSRHRLAAFLLLSAAACTDGAPLMPTPEQSATVAVPALQCVVEVQAGTMSCTPPPPAQARSAIAANRLLGGQDVNIKLASSGASYDAGSQTFQVNVTVQNLLQAPLGTVDGVTVSGVRVFFGTGPIGTGGEVTVQNPTGTAFFTEGEQPYFEYPQILDPYEISTTLTWRFNMTASVTLFTFIVYVSAPQADETQALLGPVWRGTASTAWTDAANWSGGVVPDSASTVAVPPDSLTTGSYDPVLSANAQLTNLRVGGGSTFNLGGNTLTAWGNVDVTGTISNGTVWMRGAGTVLRGTIPWLTVDGTVSAQGTTTVTGALKVMGGEAGGGTLILTNYTPLTVINPSP
jgi:hypothetical protein